jgi:hypothetical protein
MRRTLISLLATAALLGCVPAVAHAAPQDARTGTLRQLVTELPVAAEHEGGYKRTDYRHWVDADGDGCDTRREVLKAEAIDAPAQGARCALTGGEWFSYYDDTVIDGAAGLDIDHMVPLREVNDSGGFTWTPARRQAYANDLGFSRTLVAVSATTNRSKADKDPAQWLPPAADAKCHYVEDWVAVKTRWGLSVDSAEQAALTRLAASCPDVTVDVPLA